MEKRISLHNSPKFFDTFIIRGNQVSMSKQYLIMNLPSTMIKLYSYKYFIIPLLLLVTSCGKVSEDVNTSNLLIPTSGVYSWSGSKMIGSLEKLMNAEDASDVQQYGGTKSYWTELSIKPNANGDFQYELTSGSYVEMSGRSINNDPITGMMASQIIIDDNEYAEYKKTLKWFFEDNEHWGGQPPYLELEECMFKPTYDDLMELLGQSIETSEGWTYTYALSRSDVPEGECTCNCEYLDSTDIEPIRYTRNAYHIKLVYAEGVWKELTYNLPKPVIEDEYEYEELQVEANEKVVEEEMEEAAPAETEGANESAPVTEEYSEYFTSYYVDDPDGWVNLRNRPNGEIIKRVDNYEVGVKVGKEGDWILLRFDDGSEGFIHITRLKEAP